MKHAADWCKLGPDLKDYSKCLCRCLRMADAAAQQNMSVLFFGETCTDSVDMPAVQALLASENLQSAQSMFAQAQAAHQLLQSARKRQPHVEHFMRPPKPPDWCEHWHSPTQVAPFCHAALNNLRETNHERRVLMILILLRGRTTIHSLSFYKV